MAITSPVSKRFFSIKWRFVLTYVVVVFVAFSLFSAIATRIFTDYILNQRVSEQQRNLNSISVSLSPYLKEYDSDSMNQILIENSRLYGGRFLVLNANGVVLMDSFSKLPGRRMQLPEVYDIMFEDMDASYGFHDIETVSAGKIWSVNYTSAIISEYETIGILVYSESIQDIVDRGSDMVSTLALVTVIIALFIVFLSLMLSGYITKPIKSLQVVASKIANGELHQRVDTAGNNEISRLGETFNLMSERLETMDAMKSEFVSNASHELKTPLSSMKILAQSLIYDEKADKKVYKEFLTDINAEMDRLNDIISDLLLLTKIENDDRALNLEMISFSDLIGKVVNSLRPIARAKKIKLKLRTVDDIDLLADELKLRIAVVNLIENAIKYTDDKGKVDVRIYRQGNKANMEVKDTGVGIPKAEQVKIFERFYRVDKARARKTGGTGLGLH
ncbi:MAG: HAMP domain-containing sensor histidine kinase, partial [Eubacteriales bacterium]